VTRIHCPQCGCQLDARGAMLSRPFHLAIWSLGMLSFGALGLVVLSAILHWLSPDLLCPGTGFSSKRKTQVDIVAIGSALEEYAIANGGRLPVDLRALVTPDANGRTFLDMNHLPKDAWGNEYVFEPPGPSRPRPNVISYGRDGQPGGLGDDADIALLSLQSAQE